MNMNKNNIIEFINLLQNNYISEISKKSLENVKDIVKFPGFIEELLKYTDIKFYKKTFDIINKHRTFFQNNYDKLVTVTEGKINSIKFMDDMKNMFQLTKNSITYNKISKINKVLHIILNISPTTNIYINFSYINNYNKHFLKNIIGRIYSMIMTKIDFEEKEYIDNIKNMQINFILYYYPRCIYKEYNKTVDEINSIISKSGCFNSSNGMMITKYNKDPSMSYITRKNDMLGLTVHEMGHITSCDGRIFTKMKNTMRCVNIKVNLNELIKKLNISDNDNNLDTEYTEGLNSTNSSVLHSIFNAIEFNIFNKNKHNIYNLFEQFLLIEIVYSLLHTVRLLRWYRFKSIEDFIGQNNKIYKQKGLMFEYIFMKAYTLLNYNKYMKTIFNNGNIFDPYKENSSDKQQKVLNDIINHITKGTYNKLFNMVFEMHNKKEKGSLPDGKFIMDYYAVDLREKSNSMKGGVVDYYYKYLKYKKKYMKLKTRV